MTTLVTLLTAAALVGSVGLAGAQDQKAVGRTVISERTVDRQPVERYQGRDQREQQTERSTRILKLGPRGEIHVANVAGNITLTRGGNNEVTVEIVKTSRGRTVEEAREHLGLVDVEISERGGRAEMKTRYPWGEESGNRRHNRRNINVAVAFNVTAPAGTRITANSVSGDVTAKDLKGDLTLESVSGAVRISNGGSVASAKAISGDVEVSDTEIDGQLQASSVSGSVMLRNLKARILDVGSVSGNVVVQDVTCHRIEAQTVSGSVQFAGPLANGGRYEFGSHSGDVHVTLAGNTGFEVEATSFSGSVRGDNLPITEPARGRSRRGPRTLRGVYGDGSAVLELTTFSGNIVITKR